MGQIVETITKAFTRTKIPPPTGNDPWSQWRHSLPRERNYLNDVGDGSGSSLVIPAIDFIANAFAEAPVVVSEKVGDEFQDRPEHGMVELLARPNPYYSGSLLWMATIASFVADGNGYNVITQFSQSGRPAEMYWAPHWALEPKGAADGSEYLTHYRYEPGGGRQGFDLPPNQVVHYRWGLDPGNTRKGFSRLKAVLREIYSDEEAARFTAVLLRNLGVLGIVLSPKGEVSMTPQQAEDTKRDIMQKTTGEHRGEPLVMFSATDLHTYGFSPEELDLSALRAIPESRVAAALGIPAAVLGFLAGMEQTKVGATMAELREQGVESGVIPKMRLFAEELKTQLLPHYTDRPERFKVEFNVSDMRVLQEDQNKAATRWGSLYRSKLAKRSEAREALGLPVEPGDDAYFGEGDNPDPAQPQQQQQPPRSLRRRMSKGLTYVQALARDTKRAQAIFETEIQEAFEQLGKDAERRLKNGGVAFQLDMGDEVLIALVMSALSLDDWRARVLGPLYRSHYLRMATTSYQVMGDTYELAFGVDLPDPIARRVVATGGRRLGLVDVTGQTRAALFDALHEAREQGLGVSETAARIRQYVTAGPYARMEAEKPGSGVRYRAETIARTETKYAQNIASMESGREAGFTRFLAFDNRIGYDDEDCIARDGQTFSFDEAMAEIEAEHPRGTLSMSPEPASMPVAARRNGVHA